MPAQTSSITSRDGTRLHLARTTAEAARGAVLLQHGYADHGGRYQHVADTFAAAGLDVFALDLRGHGRSDGVRGKLGDVSEYLDDVEAGLAAVRAAGHARPVVLAHSMGGLVALRLLTDASRAPKDVAGLVLTSPFLGLHPEVSPLKVKAAGLLARVIPHLAMGNEIKPESLTHDPEMIAARRADTLCFSTATPGWLAAITRAQAETLAAMARLAVPSTWFVAGDDQLVDVRVTQRAYAAAGGEKTWSLLTGAHHEVLMERDRAVTMRMIIDWIIKRFQ